MNNIEETAEHLFGEALDLPRDQRPAFLDRVCAGHPHLRQKVDDLLAENDRLSGFLSQPPLPIAASIPALTTETRLLDRYRIVAQLGSGGMGVVYRARDEKLERDVAIKMLQPGVLADQEARERFRREARMLARLNHSQIAAVYDVIEHNGSDYIVMELVAGDSLAAKLRAGPLPAREATSIAVQVAEALEEAHEQGVMHRDLKPGNVMITARGQVKVLDFGLARLLAPLAADPTLSLSDAHGVMGTPRYMSPEQALGKKLDARTDLWSLGVLFYETLTALPPFQGKSSLAILHAITEQPFPPLREIQPALPPLADSIVTRALQKDPEQRYASAKEIKTDLQKLAQELSLDRVSVPGGRQAPPAPTSKPRRWKTWSAAAIILLLAAGAALFFLRHASPRPLPDSKDWQQLTFFTDSAVYPTLSSDGRMLAFIRGDNSFLTSGEVYLKLLPDGEPVQLTHDSRIKLAPSFSPDNSEVAYSVISPWDTWEVPVLGGDSRMLLPNSSSVSWIEGDKRLLFSEIKEGMHLAVVTTDLARGDSRDIYVPPAKRGMAHHSYLSPDGRSVLIVEMNSRGIIQPCRVVPFQGSGRQFVVGLPNVMCESGAWSADGKYLYLDLLTDGFHLWRQRFPNGKPEQVTFGPTTQEGIAMAPDGKSLVTAVGTTDSTVWIHDQNGNHQISSEGFASAPAFSSDGRSLYFLDADASSHGSELWVDDIATAKLDKVLPGYPMEYFSVSSDGKRVVFSTPDPSGHSSIWLAPTSRRTSPVQISSASLDDSPFFLPDGDLVFRSSENGSNFLYRMKPDGSARHKIVPDRILDFLSVSPDGRWAIATTPNSDEEHTTETRVFAMDGSRSESLCPSICWIHWDTSGKSAFLFDELILSSYPIPVEPGTGIPRVPPEIARAIANPGMVRGVDIPWNVHSALSPTAYAYTRQDTRRNLYRIPLP
jgi:eukaryotic-like serine/threonine-protein kinase